MYLKKEDLSYKRKKNYEKKDLDNIDSFMCLWL